MVSPDGAARVWVYDRFASEIWPGLHYAEEHSGLQLRLAGVPPADYRVELWDTKQQGGVTETRQETVGANGATISLPAFKIDCAIKMDPLTPVSAASPTAAAH